MHQIYYLFFALIAFFITVQEARVLFAPTISRKGAFNMDKFMEDRRDGYLFGKNTPAWLVTKAHESNELHYDPITAVLEYMSDNPEYKTTTSGLPKIYVSETVEPETLSPDNSATEVPLDESTVTEGITENPSLLEDLINEQMKKLLSFIPLVIAPNKTYNDSIKSVYPEILVVVQHSLYTKIGGNAHDAMKYLVAFWNAVDVRFKSLKEVKIHLSIAGIIIAGDPQTSHMFFQRRGFDGRYLNGDESKIGLSRFLIKDTFTKNLNYDMVVVLTGDELIGNKIASFDITGMSAFQGACKNTEYSIRSVAFVEDRGAFDGVLTAAHEIGHLLGAPHDDESICGEGYLLSRAMSYSSKAFEWSSCSQSSISKFVTSQEASCLWNLPPKDEQLPGLLPGKMLSLANQCLRLEGGLPCRAVGQKVCSALKCSKSNGTFAVMDCFRFSSPTFIAAEGSPCGFKNFCHDGKCVPEVQNDVHQQLSR